MLLTAIFAIVFNCVSPTSGEVGVWSTSLPAQQVNRSSSFIVCATQSNYSSAVIDFGDGTRVKATNWSVFTPNSTADYFKVLRNASLLSWISQFKSSSLDDCMKQCLNSVEYFCQLAWFNTTGGLCSVADYEFNAHEMNINVPVDSNQNLFTLKTELCYKDLITTGKMVSWNASSAVNESADISLNGTGWEALSNVSESLQISLAEAMLINVVQILPTPAGYPTVYSIGLSNDSAVWKAFEYNGSVELSKGVQLVNSVAQFLRINVLNTSNNDFDVASLRIRLTGCAITALQLSVNYTYAKAGIYNVSSSVELDNQNISAKTVHVVDFPIINVSATNKSPLTAIQVGSYVSYNVSGRWGPIFRYSLVRSDNFVFYNALQRTVGFGVGTIKSSFNYSVYYNKSGTQWYSIVMSNYLGTFSMRLPGNFSVQNPVRNLQLKGPRSVQLARNVNSFVLSNVSLCWNNSGPNPTNTLIQINYGDGFVSSPASLSCNSSFVTNVTNQCDAAFRFCNFLPPRNYTTRNTMNITVTVFNNISIQTANHIYIIWQLISRPIGTVSVQTPLPAGILAADRCVPVSTNLVFTALVANGSGTPANYTWSFGDGSRITTPNATLTYRYSVWNLGYVVNLTVSNPVSSASTTLVRTTSGKNFTALCVLPFFSNGLIKFTNNGTIIRTNRTMGFNFSLNAFPPTYGCYAIAYADPLQPGKGYDMWGNVTECLSLSPFSTFYPTSKFVPYTETKLSVSYPLKFSYTYKKPTLTTVTLYAANRVSSVSIPTSIMVVDVLCNIPVVNVSAGLRCRTNVTCDTTYKNAYQFLRSATITITSTYSINCAATSQANFAWSILYCNDASCKDTKNYAAADFAKYTAFYGSMPVLNGLKLPTVVFKPRAFIYGLYKICVNVSMVGQNGFWATDCGNFAVAVTPNVTSCISNNLRTVVAKYGDNKFSLNGICSVDPDLWPSEQQNLEYEWSCYRACESAPLYQSLNGSFITWGSITNYTSRCPSVSNGTIPSSNTGCFSAFNVHKSGPLDYHTVDDWQSSSPLQNPLNIDSRNLAYVSSSPKVFLWYMNGTNIIVFNSGTMFYQTAHLILLTVRKIGAPTRWSQAVTIVTFSGVLPPKLTISCISNCRPAVQSVPSDPTITVDPTSAVKLSGYLDNYSPSISYSYNWSLVYWNKSPSIIEVSNILSSPKVYGSYYNFSKYTSTSYNKLGLSLDLQFPVFESSVWNKIAIFILSITSNGVVGNSYITARINAPPKTENCTVQAAPTSGTALSTNFQINCSCSLPTIKRYFYSIGYAVGLRVNFNDFQSAMTSAKSCIWISEKTSRCTLMSSSVLPVGDPRNKYKLTVCIAVVDDSGSKNYTFIPAIVVKSDIQAAQSAFDALTTTDDKLSNMAQNNPIGTLGLMMAAANAMNSTSTTQASSTNTASSLSNAALSSLTSNVVNVVSSMPLQSAGLQTIAQAGQVLAVYTNDPSTVSSSSASKAADALANMASVLSSASESSSTSFNDLVSTATSLFIATAQIATAINSAGSLDTSYMDSNGSTKNQSNQLQSYTSLRSTVDALATVLTSRMVVDEGPTQLTTTTLSMTVETKTSSTFDHIVVKPSGTDSCTSVEFGSVNGILAKSANDTPPSASYTNTVSTASMFSWLPLASHVNSEVSLSLASSDGNRSEISVTETPPESKFIIWIDTAVTPEKITSPYVENQTLPVTKPLGQPMLIHIVPVKINSALFVSVRQFLNKSSILANSSAGGSQGLFNMSAENNTYNGSNVQFLVYLTSNVTGPTDTDFQFRCILPIVNAGELYCGRESEWNQLATGVYEDVTNGLTTSASTWWTNLTRTSNSSVNRCSRFSKRVRDPYTCMFPASLLNLTNDTIMRVGVRGILTAQTFKVNNGTTKTNETAFVQLADQFNGSSSNFNVSAYQYVPVSYTFFAYPTACYFYNTTTNQFDTNGCQVGGCSSVFATQCICSHLTSFSNVFALPPIRFDVTSVNLEAFNNSPGVMLFLMTAMCLYWIVWIWARRRDLDDEEASGVFALPSNGEQDGFAYEVTVWTGNAAGSGTTARVSCTIAGDEAETRPRYLHNVHQNAFTRGSQRTMLMTTPVWLGELSHICIWHDNSGKSPSWYFSRMLIRDCCTNKKFYFLSENWLAVNRGNNQLHLHIPVAGKQELSSFQHVFWTQSTKQLMDGHLWLSVATRPQQSFFTRVQRLTCCLLMCCMSVLFNLLGYIVRNASTGNSDSILINLGSLQITTWTLTVSCIAVAATLPINIVIITLFTERAQRFTIETNTPENFYVHKESSGETLLASEQKIRTTNGNLGYNSQTLDNDRNTNKDEETCFDKGVASIGNCFRKLSRAIFPLPWFSHFIAYGLTLALLAVCWFCILVLAYSNLSRTQMDCWLQSIVLSLLIDIIFIQPIQIILIVTFFAFILREPVKDIVGSSNASKENQAGNISWDATKTPIQSENDISPLNNAIVESLQKQAYANKENERNLLSIAAYALFIGITYAASFSLVSNDAYRQSAEIKAFVKPSKKVYSTSDVYDYLQNQMIPYLYGGTYTNNLITLYTALPKQLLLNDSVLTADQVTYFVAARLRQLRLRPGTSCTIPDWLLTVVGYCNEDFSAFTSDSADYAAGWQLNNSFVSSNQSDSLSSFFRYTGASNSFVALTSSFFGIHQTETGYIVRFSKNQSAALDAISKLQINNWIDNFTRIVYTDFITYNVQSRLFTVSYSFFDFSKRLSYVPVIFSINADVYFGSSGSFALVMQVLFVVAVLNYAVVAINKHCKTVKSNQLNGFVQDIFIFLLSVMAVSFQLCYGLNADNCIKNLRNLADIYGSFTTIFYFSTVSILIYGLVICLLSVRFIYVLFSQAQDAVEKQSRRNFNFSIQSIALFCGFVVIVFAATLNLLLLSDIRSFSTFFRALTVTVSLVTSKVNENLWTTAKVSDISQVFFVLFVFTVNFILMRTSIYTLRRAYCYSKYSALSRKTSLLGYLAHKAMEVWCYNDQENAIDDHVWAYISNQRDMEETLSDFETLSESMTSRFSCVMAIPNYSKKLNEKAASVNQWRRRSKSKSSTIILS